MWRGRYAVDRIEAVSAISQEYSPASAAGCSGLAQSIGSDCSFVTPAQIALIMAIFFEYSHCIVKVYNALTIAMNNGTIAKWKLNILLVGRITVIKFMPIM